MNKLKKITLLFYERINMFTLGILVAVAIWASVNSKYPDTIKGMPITSIQTPVVDTSIVIADTIADSIIKLKKNGLKYQNNTIKELRPAVKSEVKRVADKVIADSLAHANKAVSPQSVKENLNGWQKLKKFLGIRKKQLHN